jgi:Spy/CpxP family protein refolding chaperone
MNKKLLFTLLICFLSSNIANKVFATDCNTQTSHVCVGNTIKKETMFNALNLTEEQAKKYEEITEDNSSFYAQKCLELKKANHKLKALTSANAPTSEQKSQQKIIKNINKEIKNFQQKEDKLFKKYLTSKQKSKYTMIKKLERNDYKKASQQKDYYKSNPELQKFGG